MKGIRPNSCFGFKGFWVRKSPIEEVINENEVYHVVAN